LAVFFVRRIRLPVGSRISTARAGIAGSRRRDDTRQVGAWRIAKECCRNDRHSVMNGMADWRSDLVSRVAVIIVGYPRWLLWTILMQLVHLSRFGLRGSVTTMLAGIQGEVGRPDRMMKPHKR